MPKHFSEHIVSQISEKKIAPRPRWHFYLRDSFLWGFVFATTVLGGIAIATLIFLTVNHDWAALWYLDRRAWYLLVTVPYVWFFALGALLIVTWHNFFRTKYGYRYDAWAIGLLSVAGSALLGVLLYFLGVGADIHTVLGERVRYYSSVLYTDESVWNRPDHGFLGGTIVIGGSEADFLIEDANGREWRVLTDRNTFLESGLPLEAGQYVRVIGKIGGENVFIARAIRR